MQKLKMVEKLTQLQSVALEKIHFRASALNDQDPEVL